MTTLTLNPKYADVLQTFGNLDEIVEDILYRYTVERINERILFRPKNIWQAFK